MSDMEKESQAPLSKDWFDAIRASRDGEHAPLMSMLASGANLDMEALCPVRQLRAVEILARMSGKAAAETLAIILRAGADPEAGFEGWGTSPLGLAAYFGHDDCLASLIGGGAKLDVVDGHERTALMLARSCAGAQAMIDAGAKMDLQDDEGFTALMMAARAGAGEKLSTLARAGADMEIRSHNGRSALMEAAINGKEECVRRLAEAGAQLEARDPGGRTPLIYAARNESAECVRVLMAAGADHKAVDEDGLSALAWAKQSNCPLAIALLEAMELGAEAKAAPAQRARLSL